MLNKALHTSWLRFVTLLASSFLGAFAINNFVVPQGLYNGGLLGICQLIRTLLSEQLGFSVSGIDLAGALYLLANVPLLVLAWKTLGHTFVGKLIVCTVSNSVFMVLLPVPPQPLIEDVLTSCLVGGLLNGFANGLILTCGGSLGGMDILGMYLSKKRGFTVGRFAILYNAVVYALCLVLFNANTAIYSAIFSVVSSVFVDRIHQQNITAQALIITKNHDPELPRRIINEVGRGVTAWEGEGAYTGDGVRVLCICLSKYEIEQLQQTVRRMDPNAFITVQEGVHVSGNFPRHLS
ncbi:MAG: YitT family protein [Oscillospiraceae bacterium]|nr:YitT family protein [Oscillospiraceae bacterium]